MRRYYVVTPEYDVVIPVTDEGEGPTETLADVVEVEAENARDAVSIGVGFMLNGKNRPDKWTRFQWCRDARVDGRSPYAGVRAHLIAEDRA